MHDDGVNVMSESTLERTTAEDNDADDDPQSYTSDMFRCGICNSEMCNIDNYVHHMTLIEKCVLVLFRSNTIKDILLPRFIKKSHDYKDAINIQNLKAVDASSSNQYDPVSPFPMIDLSEVTEIEIEGHRRWKCNLCGLSFSRQAAINNHYKLLHSKSSKTNVKIERQKEFKGKVEFKHEEEVEMEAYSEPVLHIPLNPVKHIIAVESKPVINNLIQSNLTTSSSTTTTTTTWPDSNTSHTPFTPPPSAPPRWGDDTSCTVCGQIFKTVKILKAHMSIIHAKVRAFVCAMDSCHHTFKTKGSLIRHQRRHTGERPYECGNCGRNFRESGSLLRHQQARVSCTKKRDMELPRYGTTLPITPLNSDLKPKLQDIKKMDEDDDFDNTASHLHETSSHLSVYEDEPQTPPEESKAAVRAQILKAKLNGGLKKMKQEEAIIHRVSHLPLTRRDHRNNIKCKIEPSNTFSNTSEPHGTFSNTSEPISTFSNTSEPISTFSNTSESHSTFSNTSESLSTFSNTSESLSTFSNTADTGYERPSHDDDTTTASLSPPHQTDDGNNSLLDVKPLDNIPQVLRKSFTCPICYKNYGRRTTLGHHLKAHLGELGQSCNSCEKTFSCEQALSRHLATHSSLRQFECCKCGKSFKLKSHAQIHLKSHTTQKTIPCPQCRRFFKTVSARNMHMKSHTGLKAFSCSQCPKCFITKGSLQRHDRTHTGETPYTCPYCHHGFKEHGTLRRHLKHKLPCSEQAKMKSDDVGIHLVTEQHNRIIRRQIDEEEEEEGNNKTLNGPRGLILRRQIDEENKNKSLDIKNVNCSVPLDGSEAKSSNQDHPVGDSSSFQSTAQIISQQPRQMKQSVMLQHEATQQLHASVIIQHEATRQPRTSSVMLQHEATQPHESVMLQHEATRQPRTSSAMLQHEATRQHKQSVMLQYDTPRQPHASSVMLQHEATRQPHASVMLQHEAPQQPHSSVMLQHEAPQHETLQQHQKSILLQHEIVRHPQYYNDPTSSHIIQDFPVNVLTDSLQGEGAYIFLSNSSDLSSIEEISFNNVLQ